MIWIAARMRCGSLGSSQNGWSISLRIGGMQSIARESQPVGEPAVLGEEAHEVLASAALPPALKTTRAVQNPSMTSGWPSAPFGQSMVAAFRW